MALQTKRTCDYPDGCDLPAISGTRCQLRSHSKIPRSDVSGRATLKPHVMPQKGDDAFDMEIRWRRYVGDAKTIVQRIHKDRFEVARLAVEATTFEGNGYGRAKQYTVERFAAEIDLNYKTLMEWIGMMRVADKLPPGMWDGKELEPLRRVKNLTDKSTPESKVVQLFKKEIKRNPDSEYMEKALKRLRTLHYQVTKKSNLKLLKPEQTEELERLCLEIVDKVQKHKDKKMFS